MTASTEDDATADIAGQLRILTPGLTAEEVAAVTAVIVATVEELAEDDAPPPAPAADRWRLAAAARRTGLHELRGDWSASLR